MAGVYHTCRQHKRKSHHQTGRSSRRRYSRNSANGGVAKEGLKWDMLEDFSSQHPLLRIRDFISEHSKIMSQVPKNFCYMHFNCMQ